MDTQNSGEEEGERVMDGDGVSGELVLDRESVIDTHWWVSFSKVYT